MQTELSVFKTKPWTNTPEASREIQATSELRASISRGWVSRQTRAKNLAEQTTFGPVQGGYYEDAN